MPYTVIVRRKSTVVLRYGGREFLYDAEAAVVAAWHWRRVDAGIGRALWSAAKRARMESRSLTPSNPQHQGGRYAR